MTTFSVVLALLKVTALIIGALVAARLARRARAAVRHAILAATFAVLAALPAAMGLLPALELAVLPDTGSPRVSQDIGALVRPEGEVRRGTNGTPGESVGNTDREGITMASALTTATGISMVSAALGIWLTGASMVLLSLGIGLYRVQHLRRSALPSLETRSLLPSLVSAVGVGTTVDVGVHEDLNAPITCGIVRPSILLPGDAHEWPPMALSRALLHELEHVKRRDWAVQTLARVVCAMYWFHPLVWIAYRQLCLQAEHACDDAVVLQSEDTTYADQLVTLARRMAARPAVAVLGMAQRSDLAVRVAAVLDASRARGRAGMVRAGGIAAAAAVLLVALAPLQVVSARGTVPTDLALRAGDGKPFLSVDASAQSRAGAESQRGGRVSRLDRALVEAADEGDLRDVRELLDDGADVNAAVPGDGSPLIAAARNGHIELVRLLLDRGADVNLAVAGDGAPLIMAAREGHVAVVQLLLDRGAIVDLVVTGDENALIQASGEGQLEVVRLLVASGANVNARILVEGMVNQPGGEWRTPLSMAARGGHHEVVAFLRTSGAVE